MSLCTMPTECRCASAASSGRSTALTAKFSASLPPWRHIRPSRSPLLAHSSTSTTLHGNLHDKLVKVKVSAGSPAHPGSAQSWPLLSFPPLCHPLSQPQLQHPLVVARARPCLRLARVPLVTALLHEGCVQADHVGVLRMVWKGVGRSPW